MIINHHPSDAMLMSYASSALSNGFSLMVSCHLEGCQPCQEELQTMEMIGGAFLNQGSSAPLEAHSLETALDRISEPEENPVLVSHQQSVLIRTLKQNFEFQTRRISTFSHLCS